jgi:hypothetical protein
LLVEISCIARIKLIFCYLKYPFCCPSDSANRVGRTTCPPFTIIQRVHLRCTLVGLSSSDPRKVPNVFPLWFSRRPILYTFLVIPMCWEGHKLWDEFEIMVVVNVRIAVLGDLSPYILVGECQRFRGPAVLTFCFDLVYRPSCCMEGMRKCTKRIDAVFGRIFESWASQIQGSSASHVTSLIARTYATWNKT